jgi:hypothetical protein
MAVKPLRSSSPARSSKLALWRAPSVTLARLILESYLRSGWIWGEVVLVLTQFGALIEFTGNASYWFGLMNLGLGAQTILGTTIMVRRSMGARAYIPLARLSSRAAYPRALVLASSALRVPLYALYLLLVVATGRMTDPQASWLFAGSVGLLAGCVVLAAVTVALCPPMASREHRIVFLAWLVLALYLYTYSGPLASALAVVRMPLWPLTTAFAFGDSGTIGWLGVAALAIDALYVHGLLQTAELLLARRDLLQR